MCKTRREREAREEKKVLVFERVLCVFVSVTAEFYSLSLSLSILSRRICMRTHTYS